MRQEAEQRGLRVIDATCPLVTKVHLEAVRYAREGYSIILVGHADHDEVVGTMGEAPDRMFVIAHPDEVERLVVPDPDKVAFLTQTTLSVDDTRDCIAALRRRFPKIVGPSKDDICYATQNRQAAAKTVAAGVDVLLVIGAANSSNANRLVEVSKGLGTASYLINDKNDIRPEWLEGATRVGVTAGASTPEFLVTQVVEALQASRPAEVREVHVVEEDVRFGLPERAGRDRPPGRQVAARPPQRGRGRGVAVHLVTFRRGRSQGRVGAVWNEAVLDLGAIARDLAAQRGAVGRARGGFPKTMLELIQGGAPALEAARPRGRRASGSWRASPSTSSRGASWPFPSPRSGCRRRFPRPPATSSASDATMPTMPPSAGPPCPSTRCTSPSRRRRWWGPATGCVHHAVTKELDYEVELTAVIGSAGRDIPRGEALRHVFGYTIINDVTARDLQKRHGQWFKGKSLDTFCPMGPILVTADEIPDPQALAVSLRVNGQVRQSSHTSKMIFPVDQCIEVLSQGLTLLPGDVIATGTPEGVGAATGNFLKVGDRMEAEVERIGVLANKIAAP